MPLAPGSRLGVYEVLSPLGAGAMGRYFTFVQVSVQRGVVAVSPSCVNLR
jgi:hypothetical protein